MTIKERLEQVQRRISEAALRAGRDPGEVQLVAVSKLIPVERIREGIAAGIRILGENRVQEAKVKVAALEGLGVKWHLVGHLQTNKAKATVEHAGMVHSLDSLRLAVEIDRAARLRGLTLPVLVQVNVSGEAAKGGFGPEEVSPFLDELARREQDRPWAIDVEGLMTMAPLTTDEPVLRATFRMLRELMGEMSGRRERFLNLRHLSMGMSNDYRVAIEEGSTMVRLGTRIFGTRGEG